MEKILEILNKHQVRYLLVGGQAMRLQGMPRFSMDWDLFIPSKDHENIARINSCLQNVLDEPLVPLGKKGENFVQTYQIQCGILQFHLGLPGVRSFDEAEKHSVAIEADDGIRIKCLGDQDLLASKKAADRDSDQADIEFLEAKKRFRSS